MNHECKRAQAKGTARARLVKQHMQNTNDEAGWDRKSTHDSFDSSTQLGRPLPVEDDYIII